MAPLAVSSQFSPANLTHSRSTCSYIAYQSARSSVGQHLPAHPTTGTGAKRCLRGSLGFCMEKEYAVNKRWWQVLVGAAVGVLAGTQMADAESGLFLNRDRGFQPERLQLTADFDTINTFNGNLVFSLPLGQQYPLSGEFSYGLSLVYNSNVWDHEVVTPNIFPPEEASRMSPGKHFNAGLGFQVSLGRIEVDQVFPSVVTYVAPDGSQHGFSQRLHQDEAGTSPDFSYTNDGSYLRLKTLASGWRLEFPDGKVHIFNSYGLPVEITDQYGLANPLDPAANRVRIAYQPNTTAYPIRWTITDQHNRTQTVHFRIAIDNRYIVDRIELSAFNTATPLVYKFLYNEMRTIPRGCPHNEPPISGGGGVDPTVAVSLLTSVCSYDSPTNTTTPFACFKMDQLADYDLGYDPVTGTPRCTTGTLTGLTLPTLGRIEWGYGAYLFPAAPDCESHPRRGAWLSSSYGVQRRRLIDVNGTMTGEWVYNQQLDSIHTGCAVGGNPPPRYSTTTVTDPLGNKTEYFYSVSIDDAAGGWRIGEYAAPISHHASDGNGRFISERYKDATGAIKREVYRTFDWDQSNVAQSTDLNRRMTSERIEYIDLNRHADLDLTGFDGYGNFRSRITDGDFGAGGNGDPDADNDRTTYVNYNPGMGSYPGGSHVQWPTTTAWILGTYTDSTETGMGAVAKTVSCFEGSTGRLKWKRTLVGPSAQGSNDLLVRFSHDTAGNVLSEYYYGGDTGGLGNTNPSATCAIAPTGLDYQINHSYLYGVRSTSQFAGANFYSLDLTPDWRTGLPITSRDSATLQSTFDYDALGRLKSVSTPDLATSRYTYFTAIGTSQKARVDIEYLPPSGSGTQLAFERVRWEAFGRIHAYDRQLPGGALSTKLFKYNALGWPTFESEQGSTTKGKVFLKHDLFGRPATIRPADGASHDVQFWYAGQKDITRRVRVALDPSGVETEVRMSEKYNRQGRLWRVTENSGSELDDTNLETEYVYDVGGRLTRVEMDRSARGQGVQRRYFCYDNRGFLLRERMPEKNGTGLYDCSSVLPGTVTYSSYDAMGHPGRKTDGPSDLSFTYDPAGRLIEVWEVGTGRLLKRFMYGAGTAASDRSRGKLSIAERYNYVTLGIGTTNPVDYVALVRERYSYGGLGGKISYKITELILTNSSNSWTSDVFDQSYQYDALGNVTQITYPDRCTTCGTPNPNGDWPRLVNFGYTNGFLTSVPGYASSITYHPSGLLNTISHQNGVVETTTADANVIGRPAAIGTTNVSNSLNWSTGAIAYDGAGNIRSMGSSLFRYDAYGRLAFAQVATARNGLGAGPSQQYEYDDFGNLKKITSPSSGSLLNIPVDSATNRLNGAFTAYDAAGNLTQWNGAQSYTYDAFHMPWRVVLNGSQEWIHLYTADDERFYSYQLPSGLAGGWLTRYTLRDLDGKVLRELSLDRQTNWFTISHDYIYRDGKLLAAEVPGNRYHYHLDHLGTPRQITNFWAQEVGLHTYFPYGEEISDQAQNTERMKFTGHERDLHAPGAGDELDYMHARYYNPTIGRFLSVDPLRDSASLTRPQSWNRYGYARSNPINRTDPTGEADFFVIGEADAVPLIGGEIEVHAVLDFDSNDESGIGVGGAFAAGLNLGVGAGVGGVMRDIEGRGYSLDANLGAVSISVLFDDEGFNGLAVTAGPGVGGSAGVGESTTYTVASMKRDLGGLASALWDLATNLFQDSSADAVQQSSTLNPNAIPMPPPK